jgi:hypothetical protein
MDRDLTPDAALAAASATRSTATARVVPGWFPAASASTLSVGGTLVGAWLLLGGSTGRLLGLVGAVVMAGFLVQWVAVVTGWHRRGVIPAPPRLNPGVSPRRRRASLVVDWVAITLSAATMAATLPVTGNLGWTAIAAGWLGGASSWCRLRSLTA